MPKSELVFDSQKEGQSDIYVLGTDTRVPRRLTNDTSDDVTPSVSHDGKWIYFSSIRTGRWEIWRMPAEGDQAMQMTHDGGTMPFESPDGEVIYYQKTLADSDVWKVPVAGGEETRVLGPVGGLQFAREHNLIKLALEQAKGKVTHAARILGMSYPALNYMLRTRHKDLLPYRTPIHRRPRKS